MSLRHNSPGKVTTCVCPFNITDGLIMDGLPLYVIYIGTL